MSAHYTDADVQPAAKTLRDAAFRARNDSALMRFVLDAVAPAIAARALRDLAEAMDSGWIDMDDLRYKTTDAPNGWAEPCITDAWESMLVWAPYLRLRADEIERGTP